MTLLDIRSTAAAYLHRTVPDFTINGVDLSLVALNQIRQTAELQNDFNFNRRTMTLMIDGTVGGSLSDALDWFTQQPYEIKSIVDVGQYDDNQNLTPVEWTTVAAGLDIQRAESLNLFRYPTDGQAMTTWGSTRVVFSGNTVFLFPKAPEQEFTLGIESYVFSQDWTGNETSDIWLDKGHQYLLWMLVIHLNQVYRDFVFRQEGNLPPPQTLADAGLSSLITWDTFKYEQSRRHNR